MHGSLHRQQSIGTAAGNDPFCKRVAIPARLADPLCRRRLIESHFQNCGDEFWLGCTEFVPDRQAICAVCRVRSIGGVKGNAKFFVHADPRGNVS